MAFPCEECSLEDKILQCCGRYPPGGESTDFMLGEGRVARACPGLDPAGKCRWYAARPKGCADFFCAFYVTRERSAFGFFPGSRRGGDRDADD